MRLSGSVVSDDEHAHVVHGFVQRKLGYQDSSDAFGHVVGKDVGGYQLFGFAGTVGVKKLDDRLDRLELDQIAIPHRLPSFTHHSTSNGTRPWRSKVRCSGCPVEA